MEQVLHRLPGGVATISVMVLPHYPSENSSIHWYHDGVLIEQESPRFTVTNNGLTLNISSLTESDEGAYTASINASANASVLLNIGGKQLKFNFPSFN